MGTWKTLYPVFILHAPGSIRVRGSVSQASLEPGPSGSELSAVPTG